MHLQEVESLKVIVNPYRESKHDHTSYPDFLSLPQLQAARRFHQTLAGYQVTPLAQLPALAQDLGVGGIYVKDESHRFGLNAFKVLGGSFALAKFISERVGMQGEDVSFGRLCSPLVRSHLWELTFCTATDGNHGRGLAWAAKQLGHKCVVYLPRGAAESRVEAIRALGATTYVTDLNYDDTVRMAVETSQRQGWHVVQDTAWEGYEQIPKWIMQGYATLFLEAVDQLRGLGTRPTHIFLQAGVGSLAGAILGAALHVYEDKCPRIIIMEPDNAACVFASALTPTGKAQRVLGDLDTIMAGLSCGEVNPIAWEILRAHSDMFVSCPDSLAALGMRVLANPLGGDPQVQAGESGSIGIGLLAYLLQRPGCEHLRNGLGLNETAKVLLINTEGYTDPLNARQILWEGKYPLQ